MRKKCWLSSMRSNNVRSGLDSPDSTYLTPAVSRSGEGGLNESLRGETLKFSEEMAKGPTNRSV